MNYYYAMVLLSDQNSELFIISNGPRLHSGPSTSILLIQHALSRPYIHS
jgi:hypothetical protein